MANVICNDTSGLSPQHFPHFPHFPLFQLSKRKESGKDISQIQKRWL